MSELMVVTAIFGGYDTLRTPKVHSNVPHICLTDGSVNPVPPWEIRIVHPGQPDRRLNAYHCKMLLHRHIPDLGTTLWIDGNFRLNTDPAKLANTYLAHHDIATFEHFARDCTYKEAGACITFRRFTPSREAIEAQVAAYRAEGFPEHAGMIEGCVLLRRYTPWVIDFQEKWWAEAMKYSSRFQLSFNYLMWKHDLSYRAIPSELYYKSVKQYRHLKRDP